MRLSIIPISGRYRGASFSDDHSQVACEILVANQRCRTTPSSVVVLARHISSAVAYHRRIIFVRVRCDYDRLAGTS